MTQTRYDLVLPIDALRSILSGEILEIQADEGTVISVCCDGSTVETFRDYINKAMLNLLPTPPLVN